MAQRARTSWLGDRPLCGHVRSCAFLLLSRVEREIAGGIHAGVETMDEQANRTKGQAFWSHLAGRILRPHSPIQRELRTEVGLHKRKSSSGKARGKFGAMAVAGRNRVAKIIEPIAYRDRRGPAFHSGRDHRFRLQQLFFLACSVLLFISRTDQSQAGDTKIWEEFSGEKALVTFNGLLIWGHAALARTQLRKPGIISRTNCGIRAGR